MELNNCQFLRLPLLVWKFLNEATVDLVLLAAIEQFKYQATNRLHWRNIYEDSGTTQKEDVKKTPAKTLPSTLSKHCMCTISIFAPSLITASLTVHSLSFTYRLNYLLHFSIASFPGLLGFYLPFANTCERRTSEKQGSPGSIHHVNDIK